MAKLKLGFFTLYHGGSLKNIQNRHLVITAHGAHCFGKAKVPKWAHLHFYAPERRFMISGGVTLEEIGRGKIAPAQTVDGTGGNVTVQNYWLQHFEDNNESEELLEGDIERSHVNLQNKKAAFAFDVLAVTTLVTTFNTALDTLNRHNLHYSHIHCSFCRVKLWRALLAPKKDPEKFNYYPKVFSPNKEKPW